jgi:hypothetical protein
MGLDLRRISGTLKDINAVTREWKKMTGPIYQYLAEDHRRMEALLTLAAAGPEARGVGAYAEFRAALLRHIGMEEKILIPAALRARGGKSLPIADRIRLDHGALAALLVPPPTPEIVAAIRAILSGHNPLEEGKGGLYETCERLAGDEAERLLDRLRNFPCPRLKPHVSGPGILDATRRALSRAGYDWDELVSRTSA